jgi:hypothetical protein
MLTATYTLVALSVEQTPVRAGLQSLRQMLHAYYLHQPALTAAQVDYATGAMQRLYDGCLWRKLDKFLLPALRRATRLADDLLGELDALTAQATDALAVSTAFEGGMEGEQVNAFCTVVETFCRVLLTRIEREEQELFPLARVAVPGEAWFALANQMLAHDAYLQEQRGEPVQLHPPRQAWRPRRELGGRPGAGLTTLH